MDTTKLKSFWEKPQGTTGMAFLAGLGVVGAIAVLKNLDILIALAANTLYLGLLLGAIFLVVSCLMNKKFRFVCGSMFQSAMTAITGIWIAVDPIGILRNYLEDMKEKMKRIAGYITQLAGQVGKVLNDIATREANAKDHLRQASAAKKLGENEEATLKANMAARELEYAERRKVSLAKMQQTLDILKKMEKGLKFLYIDTEHQVEILSDEYKAVKASWKAMKGAQELIEGDDAKAIFEQTCQYMADQIGTKLGEMDRFFEQAHGPLTSMNIANEVFNEQGLEMLSAWEKDGILSYKSGSLEAGKPGVKIRVDTSDPTTDELEAQQMAEAAANGDRPSSFQKIFAKKP